MAPLATATPAPFPTPDISPDIRLDAMSFAPDPPVQGQPLTITVVVVYDPRIAAEIQVALSQDGSRLPVQTLTPQATGARTVQFTLTPATAGLSTFAAAADPDDRIRERFESNNALSRMVSIAPAAP